MMDKFYLTAIIQTSTDVCKASWTDAFYAKGRLKGEKKIIKSYDKLILTTVVKSVCKSSTFTSFLMHRDTPQRVGNGIQTFYLSLATCFFF